MRSSGFKRQILLLMRWHRQKLLPILWLSLCCHPGMQLQCTLPCHTAGIHLDKANMQALHTSAQIALRVCPSMSAVKLSKAAHTNSPLMSSHIFPISRVGDGFADVPPLPPTDGPPGAFQDTGTANSMPNQAYATTTPFLLPSNLSSVSQHPFSSTYRHPLCPFLCHNPE